MSVAATPANLFASKHILLVEPSEAVRGTITAMLLELGFVYVTDVGSRAEAEKLIAVQDFDVIVSEHMPGQMDGIELLLKVRANDVSSRKSFVLISSNIDQATVIQAIKSGVSEFIVKPFSLKTFGERLTRAIAAPIKATPAQLAQAERMSAAPQKTEAASILVVDDVPDNIRIVSEVIKSDYRVKAATSGEKAIRICCSNNPPDVVLLDIMMPDVDGLTVCRKLKSHPMTQHIIVIFITAMDQTEDVVKGLELGAVDYITKPINPQILKARVKTHVQIATTNKILREQVDVMMDYAQLRTEFDRVLQTDLKKPIDQLAGAIEQLDAERYDPDKVGSNARHMRQSCSQIASFVGKLNLLHKLEDKSYKYVPRTVNFTDITRDVLQRQRPVADKKRLKVQSNLGASKLVLGDQTLLDTVVENLLKNAYEAAPQESVILVDHVRQGNSVTMSIHNDGAIPAEIQSSFFDKYVTHGKPEATGVGSYAAKIMTEAQNGKIWFLSTPEIGTTLFVEIPITSAK